MAQIMTNNVFGAKEYDPNNIQAAIEAMSQREAASKAPQQLPQVMVPVKKPRQFITTHPLPNTFGGAIGGEVGQPEGPEQPPQYVPWTERPDLFTVSQQLMMKGLQDDYAMKLKASEEMNKNQDFALGLYGKNLERLESSYKAMKDQARSNESEAMKLWDDATNAADEYTHNAQARAASAVAKLEQTYKEFSEEMDFAKAHDMQAQAMAVRGSMRDAEREVAQQYGADSPEFAQFAARKQVVLGQTQSQIQAAWGKIREERQNAYLGILGQTVNAGQQYASFADQARVDTYRYRAASLAEYSIQQAAYEISLEQLMSSEYRAFAEYVTNMPYNMVDMAPYLSTIAEILQNRRDLMTVSS